MPDLKQPNVIFCLASSGQVRLVRLVHACWHIKQPVVKDYVIHIGLFNHWGREQSLPKH